MIPPRPPGIECPDWEADSADPKGRRCRQYAVGADKTGLCQLATRHVCTEWLRVRGLSATRAQAHEDTSRTSLSPQTAPGPDGLVAQPLDPPTALSVLAPPDRAAPAPEAPAAEGFRLEPSPRPARPASPPAPLPPALSSPALSSPALFQNGPQGNGAEGAGRRGPFKTAAEHARQQFEAVLRGGETLFAAPPDYVPAKEVDAASLEALEARGVEVELSTPGLRVEPSWPIVLVPRHTGKPERHELTFREAATLRMIVDCLPGAQVVGWRASGKTDARPPERIPLPRTPEGTINNCALANGADEEFCQMCVGGCPDRGRFPR